MRTKAPPPTHPIYVSLAEVDAAIHALGILQREAGVKRIEMDERLAAVRQDYTDFFGKNGVSQAQLVLGIRAYCDANRDMLTKQRETKTVHFTHGDIHWRLPGWSVVLAVGASYEKAIAYFKSRAKAYKQAGIDSLRYVRVKEELNKEALLEDRAKLMQVGVEHIAFSNKEDFVIEPYEARHIESVVKEQAR